MAIKMFSFECNELNEGLLILRKGFIKMAHKKSMQGSLISYTCAPDLKTGSESIYNIKKEL